MYSSLYEELGSPHAEIYTCLGMCMCISRERMYLYAKDVCDVSVGSSR